jgi:hypothetical protein
MRVSSLRPPATVPPSPDEEWLRAALAPHVSSAWPIARLLTLVREWRAHSRSTVLGERCGVSKNAAISKIHRIIDSATLGDFLTYRPSPITGDGTVSRCQVRPLSPGTRTIPLLPSERAALGS